MEGEKESVLPFVGEERIRGAYTLRKESEKELLRERLRVPRFPVTSGTPLLLLLS